MIDLIGRAGAQDYEISPEHIPGYAARNRL